MSAAATVADARARWADADDIPDDVLADVLDASWTRCRAFLPADVVDDPAYVPTSAHVDANVLDARELWQSYRRDGDVVGFDTYAVRVRPLSDTVRSLLRPRRGVPLVG